MSFGAVAASVAGAAVGGLMSDDSGSSQTASKEPWEPARKPLINSINTGQGLERYYQQNPFNPLLQQGYQNLFADLDQFRSQLSPQLMQFANSMMQSDYQRGPRNSQVEAMGRPMQQQMPQQYQTKPMQMQGSSGGLLQQSGAFSAPRGQSYGLLDFQALNPYNNALKPKQPDQQTIEQAVQAELDRRQRESQYAGSAPYGDGA